MDFRRTFAAALFLSALSTMAWAQESEAPAAPAPAGPAWVVNCSSGATGTALTCQMSQNLTETKSGRRVLTVTIRQQGGEAGLAMLLALPHGLFLPAGATYQVDDGEKATVAIQTSDQNGAYAAVPLNEGLLGALESGSSLKIGMESVTRQPVTIPVSLTGFSAAMDRLESVN